MSSTNADQEQSMQARESLHDARERSRAAAGRLPESAPWYDALWLAYIGGLVLSLALPTPINLLAIALLLFGLIKAMNAYQERYGVWVSGFRGFRRGRTRVVAVVLSIVLSAILLTVWYFRQQHGLTWAVLPGAVVAMGIGYILGRMWMRAYRRETGQS